MNVSLKCKNNKIIKYSLAVFSLLTSLLFISNASAQVLKMGHIYPPEHPVNQAAVKAAKEITKRTDGRVEIQVFPAGQIGSAKEILVGMSIGTHQMALDGAGILSQWEPKLGVFEAPYLAKNFDHLKRLAASPKGQEILESLRKKKNLHMLDVWYYGTRELTNNKKPIKQASDLKDLKIRVPEVTLSLEFAKQLDMQPTPMAFPELYLGLQTGVVDGQENPLPTINSAKFYEVQKYLAITDHLVQFVSPIIDENTWKTISKSDQKIMLDTFKEVGDAYSKNVEQQEKALIKTLEEKGMVVTYPDKTEIAKKLTPLYGKFEKVWGKGTYSELSKVK